jgi:hypothetical protein
MGVSVVIKKKKKKQKKKKKKKKKSRWVGLLALVYMYLPMISYRSSSCYAKQIWSFCVFKFGMRSKLYHIILSSQSALGGARKRKKKLHWVR